MNHKKISLCCCCCCSWCVTTTVVERIVTVCVDNVMMDPPSQIGIVDSTLTAHELLRALRHYRDDIVVRPVEISPFSLQWLREQAATMERQLNECVWETGQRLNLRGVPCKLTPQHSPGTEMPLSIQRLRSSSSYTTHGAAVTLEALSATAERTRLLPFLQFVANTPGLLSAACMGHDEELLVAAHVDSNVPLPIEEDGDCSPNESVMAMTSSAAECFGGIDRDGITAETHEACRTALLVKAASMTLAKATSRRQNEAVASTSTAIMHDVRINGALADVRRIMKAYCDDQQNSGTEFDVLEDDKVRQLACARKTLDRIATLMTHNLLECENFGLVEIQSLAAECERCERLLILLDSAMVLMSESSVAEHAIWSARAAASFSSALRAVTLNTIPRAVVDAADRVWTGIINALDGVRLIRNVSWSSASGNTSLSIHPEVAVFTALQQIIQAKKHCCGNTNSAVISATKPICIGCAMFFFGGIAIPNRSEAPLIESATVDALDLVRTANDGDDDVRRLPVCLLPEQWRSAVRRMQRSITFVEVTIES